MRKIKLINNHLLKRLPIACPICGGGGSLECERPRAQNFNRDVGEMDTVDETCDACDGTGIVEMDDDDELDNDE